MTKIFGDEVRGSASIGIAEYRGGDVALSLFHRVDRWLCEAKDRGRYQVVGETLLVA